MELQCLVLCTPNSLLSSVRQRNFIFSVFTALIYEERPMAASAQEHAVYDVNRPGWACIPYRTCLN
jgi:hypothetical protein